MSERRLRVMHLVCGEFERGGMQKHVLDLSRAQAAIGDDVFVAAHPTFREHIDDRVEFLPIDTLRSRRDREFRSEVRSLIGGARPLILHAHAGKAAAVVASIMPITCATVATVHGIKRRLKAPSRFDRVIAVSEFAARGLPRDRTRVVYNGISWPASSAGDGASLDAFFDGDPSVPVAIAVGRLAPVKGFDVAIRAWRAVEGARLLIVGEGPERRRLERLVERFGLRRRVAFAGERPEALSLIAKAALLVAPSAREGFGYVVAEALLARVPVLTTVTSGASPVIPPDFLIRAGDANALARVALRVLEDPEGVRAAFGATFERAERDFTLEGMLRRTREVYLESIASREGQIQV